MNKIHKALLSNEDEADIKLTPMLDIFFIMLIFFVVTSSFVKEPKNSPLVGNKELSIVVGINKSGEIWVNKNHIDIKSLRRTIEKIHLIKPDENVIITADKESKSSILVTVMDQIKLAGIKDISIGSKKHIQQ